MITRQFVLILLAFKLNHCGITSETQDDDYDTRAKKIQNLMERL